jgi:hypothetical protein
MKNITWIYPLLLLLLLHINFNSIVAQDSTSITDSTPFSSKQAAISYINKLKYLQPSKEWPNIVPRLFLENIRLNIISPLKFYEGQSTNFCSYAALTYLLINDNPLGYAQLMVGLYKNGTATYTKTRFHPSKAVKIAAGTLKFKGVLDIRPADQMWFLCLANHFKGYLNLLDRHYNPGDEDNFWAATNYSKFNRMVKILLQYRVESAGSDLIRPMIRNLYTYIKSRMDSGTVILYVNNKLLHRTRNAFINLAAPSHFIIVKNIRENKGIITLTYWDYGMYSQQELPITIFKKIIYGVSYCTRKKY